MRGRYTRFHTGVFKVYVRDKCDYEYIRRILCFFKQHIWVAKVMLFVETKKYQATIFLKA